MLSGTVPCELGPPPWTLSSVCSTQGTFWAPSQVAFHMRWPASSRGSKLGQSQHSPRSLHSVRTTAPHGLTACVLKAKHSIFCLSVLCQQPGKAVRPAWPRSGNLMYLICKAHASKTYLTVSLLLDARNRSSLSSLLLFLCAHALMSNIF